MASGLEGYPLLFNDYISGYSNTVSGGSKELYGDEGSIHIEVLLPAFVLGMIMKHKEHDTPVERKVSTGIFIFLHVPGGNEYAAFYRSELCGDSCWFLFRDWFAGDDVVGNDYVSCGDCLFIVEYRKALSDVLFIVTGN